MKKTQKYKISRDHGVIAYVRGIHYLNAADIFARRENGRTAYAYRTTGDSKASGYFMAYKSAPFNLGGSVSVGKPFHVSEVE